MSDLIIKWACGELKRAADAAYCILKTYVYNCVEILDRDKQSGLNWVGVVVAGRKAQLHIFFLWRPLFYLFFLVHCQWCW